ncbi:MAG: glutamine amidotransferase [Gammaproteobacteria bacterium]
MKTALVITHVPFENLGSFVEPLAHHEYRIRYREAGVDNLGTRDSRRAELLIVLGGAISAMDEANYPFLRDELQLLNERVQKGRPTLGICLGAQLMARALGSRVYPAARKELGWGPIALTTEGRHSCLRHLAENITPVVHWHGDTFDLPDGALRLASTELCKNQAFAIGNQALGLQFHPEVTASGLERWFIGHALEIATTEGVSVSQLRSDTARWADILECQARKCIDQWLSGLDDRVAQ